MPQKTPKDPNRISKVNSHIQQVLGEVLREYLSEHQGLVTVTKVETSVDKKWAKVWISIFGGSDQDILDTIQKNIYNIQGDLNRTFTTKIVPRLQFFLDTSPRYVQHIEELVRKIHEEDK